jgi:hypothetical protein
VRARIVCPSYACIANEGGYMTCPSSGTQKFTPPAIAVMLQRAASFILLMELQCVLPLPLGLEGMDMRYLLNMFVCTHIWFAT